MTKTTEKVYHCQYCGTLTTLYLCNECNQALLKKLLTNPYWIENAKTRNGDRPNESMYDTIKREYQNYNN